MNIKMKLIVGVVLLVIQLYSTSALKHENSVRAKRGAVEKANQIIFDIKGRRFNNAYKKAQGLSDLEGTINYVISEVYNNDQHNAELILNFLDSKPSEVKVSLAVYDALNYEMNQKKHNDYVLRLQVMKSFNGKPFDLQLLKVSKVRDKLRKKVKGLLVDELKSAILSKSSDKIKTICDDVHDYYPEVFHEVIKRLMEESFDQIDAKHKHYLITFFFNHKYPEQSMSVYAAMYKELSHREALNQYLVVLLASGVKEAMNKTSDLETLRRGGHLRDKLPSSIKHVAFSSPVYIVNKNGEYLYAASDGFNYDEQRRTVFTWTPEPRPGQGKWIIERHSDTYRIKNLRTSSHSEYMFRSLIPTRMRTNVLTWIPGGVDDYRPAQFNWTFEPSGDYVYIRNELNKEYLHVTNEYEGLDRDDRRYVQLDNEKSDRSLWKIVDY